MHHTYLIFMHPLKSIVPSAPTLRLVYVANMHLKGTLIMYKWIDFRHDSLNHAVY